MSSQLGKSNAPVIPISSASHDRQPSIKTKNDLIRQIQPALLDQQFFLLFQPQYNLATGEVTGFEALARWEHPNLGTIPPVQFIPLAEECGLIHELGHELINQALVFAKAISNYSSEALSISINLSGAQFHHHLMIANLMSQIRASGIDARMIRLEITETVLLNNSDRLTRDLNKLRALGPRIYLDDFGTGYSSLAYLKRLPLDGVKIDKSFVQGMLDHPVDLEIIRSVMAISDVMEIDVIAEGIEQQSQADQLRLLGCNFGQGFLLAKPVPFNKALKLAK